MNQDIICLLHDLGKDNAVDIISNYILINPDVEALIAAKMGNILSSESAGASNQSSLSGAISRGLAFALSGSGCYKMIFVVNMDLNMGRGKQCAQVAHAALGLYLDMKESQNHELAAKVQDWIHSGQKKIVVKADGIDQMKMLQGKANEAGLPNHLVSDAGCTQIAPGSKTVLAIFGSNEELDRITGSLKLL